MASPGTALDILLRARELPWCQGAFARDAAGGLVDFRDAKAVSFCSVGAMRRVALSSHGGSHSGLLRACELLEQAWKEHLGLRRRPRRTLEALNDRANEPEVRAVQDRAIELARTEVR